ncbi:hypothetical protein ACH427_32030 [Streptomyces sp. NPDC020379]|uniref:hypothetical protein n=1 Tax=Streptomyces sp. NPDC020379 TaxID=3365071 RepID=UPI0037A9FCB1
MSEQSKIDRAADRISEAVRKDKDSGYAGIKVSAEKRELELYWRGVKPKQIEDLLKSLRSSVKVVELPARYTRAALKVEAERIIKNGDSEIAEKRDVVSAGPREDGSGVSIDVSSSLDKQKKSLAAATAPFGTKKSSRGIPAFVEKSEKSTPISRSDQQAHAGAYLQSAGLPAGNRCSTGFTISVSDFVFSQRLQLTAAHCVTGLGDNVRNASGGWFGGVAYYNRFLDIAAISNNSFFDNLMWDGPWQGDGQFLKGVHGLRKNYVGDYVCTSGAASGAICNIKIDAVDQTVRADSGTHGPVVIARQQTGNAPAAGQGDSGGPVFSLDGAGVIARGIASSGRDNVPCQGHQFRTCFSTLECIGIDDAIAGVQSGMNQPWADIYRGG